MGIFIGKNKKIRRAYGFDEIALVPGTTTINPAEVNTSWQLGNIKLNIPIIAAAMDGVVDVKFATSMNKLGGLAVLNLEGVQTRYENPDQIITELVKAPADKATKLVQDIYKEPIKEELIARRIKEIKSQGCIAAVSAIPKRAEKFAKIVELTGADIFVIQATVITTNHISTQYKMVDLKQICKSLKIPVIIGNCVNYNAALELMQTGASAILVGVGPGAACTTRGVLGIGVPQVTATVDCAAARDYYFEKSGRYVSIITDGGMDSGGDICKAFASGADAVMVGSLFARAKEAPGKGNHWGMATPDRNLPRGTRIKVGVSGSIEEILVGPAKTDDGSQNLLGALKTSMGTLGAKNIKEMHNVDMVIAPAIKTEGKLLQKAQNVGMGKK